ncbi:MAG TPA: hypothetical protein PKY81_07565 [bacterium]|nr:hypothetical protein [bacterium]HPN30799.1 hypothetical protein [bacterium]
MAKRQKSKVNTIILLIIIIVSMYFIFKLAIPIVNRGQESKAKLDERNQETSEQLDKTLGE